VFAFLFTTCTISASPKLFPPFGDIVIYGGTIIDGTGAPGRRANIFVSGQKIKEIRDYNGGNPGIRAEAHVIDATGKVVTPGFIDTHSHGEPDETPEMHNFLAMGVTTLCLGQDGTSMRVTTMTEWIRDIETTVPGPNILTIVGHGTIRTESGVRLSTAPAEAQIQKMAELVEKGLKEGAWGLSTGLEYLPGTFSTPAELEAVARPVGRRGLAVLSHMRNEDDDQLSSSIQELVAQCRATGARAHISHLKSVYGKGSGRAQEILALIESVQKSGQHLSADMYPYTASHTGLSILFPPWALPPNSYKEVLASRREELIKHLHDRVMRRNGPEATLLSKGANAGKTLAQLATEKGKPFAEVLADLGPRGGSAAYFVMDEELQDRLLLAPYVNICTDGSPDMRHPRGYGSFARVIRKFVQEEKKLTLEAAVHKMSGLTAQNITLDKHGRGTLREGNFADILVFDPSKVRDTATFENPQQLAEGFDTVIVNGTVVRENGEFNGTRAGQFLRRPE